MQQLKIVIRNNKNAECTLTSKIVAVEYPVVTSHPHPQVSQDQHCKSGDYSKVYVVVTSFLQTKLQQNNIDNALSLKVGTLITTVLYIRLFLFVNRKCQRYSIYILVSLKNVHIMLKCLFNMTHTFGAKIGLNIRNII